MCVRMFGRFLGPSVIRHSFAITKTPYSKRPCANMLGRTSSGEAVWHEMCACWSVISTSSLQSELATRAISAQRLLEPVSMKRHWNTTGGIMRRCQRRLCFMMDLTFFQVLEKFSFCVRELSVWSHPPLALFCSTSHSLSPAEEMQFSES